MEPCGGCGRHVPGLGACPFCGAAVVAKGVMAGAAVLVLAACYGPAPAPADCVPSNEAEICDDGLDNDCNGDVDAADAACAPSE